MDWYPWGVAALQRARTEDKPIFLSIGYAACHWCHVMAHESFEDPAVASFLNQHFINIKVDREERPDLDNLYMSAVVAMTGQGGWPMSIFLTPDGHPFYGGTYFPPARRYNMPAFIELLQAIHQAWLTDRVQITASSEKIKAALAQPVVSKSSQTIDPHAVLKSATDRLAAEYDQRNGGWGGAPKFPQPQAIQFLLELATAGNQTALKLASHALSSMAAGGMWDLVGGGFSRYSVDARWEIPHFEKMLYDNAQLACVYLYGHCLTKSPHYRDIAEHTLDFMLNELQSPEGAFYSSLDADSEGEEGKFYRWDLAELQAVCAPDDWPLVQTTYGLEGSPNFDGYWILRRRKTTGELALQFNLTEDDITQRLERFRGSALNARNKRIRPALDDKILLAWNGLAITALAEAARLLHQPRYLTAAQTCAQFLLDNLRAPQGFFRIWRAGEARHLAYLEDYATLGLALINLYQADHDPAWFAAAREMGEFIINHFRDPAFGFYDTSELHEQLIARPKDLQDNATPCGNSQTANLLLRLAILEGRSDWAEEAHKPFSTLSNLFETHPTAFGNWLCAMDFGTSAVAEVAIITPPGNQLDNKFAQSYNTIWRPRALLAVSAYPPPSSAPQLVQNREPIDDATTAYICQGFVCAIPATDLAEFNAQLANQMPGIS